MTGSVAWVGLGTVKLTHPGECAATVETTGLNLPVMLIKFFQALFTK